MYIKFNKWLLSINLVNPFYACPTTTHTENGIQERMQENWVRILYKKIFTYSNSWLKGYYRHISTTQALKLKNLCKGNGSLMLRPNSTLFVSHSLGETYFKKECTKLSENKIIAYSNPDLKDTPGILNFYISSKMYLL